MPFPAPEPTSLWRIVQFGAFVVDVLLFLLVSSAAGMRGAGLLTLAGAAIQLVKRRIPYGWEGREPSGYITGTPAVILSLLIGLVGIAMIVQPELMLALLGWSKD